MKFSMNIEMGNDKMRTAFHVAMALKKLVDKMLAERAAMTEGLHGGKIIDDNGNSVGEWEIDLGERKLL